MHKSHRLTITARQMQMSATSSSETCAVGQSWLRQAAAKNEGNLNPRYGESNATAEAARRETPRCQAASGTTGGCGTNWPGHAAAWHVVPNSPPLCIGGFAAHSRGVLRCFGWLAQPASGTAVAWSPRQSPRASSTKARPNARFGKAVPNRSVKASPNSWPGLPFLGHFSYRPIQAMPGQLLAPPYLQR